MVDLDEKRKKKERRREEERWMKADEELTAHTMSHVRKKQTCAYSMMNIPRVTKCISWPLSLLAVSPSSGLGLGSDSCSIVIGTDYRLHQELLACLGVCLSYRSLAGWLAAGREDCRMKCLG